MTLDEAEAAARELLGPAAACRHDPRAPDAAGRLVALNAYHAALAKPYALRPPGYQRLRAVARRYRCTVGRVEDGGGFTLFLIDGEGDTWEAALAACRPRGVPDAQAQ